MCAVGLAPLSPAGPPQSTEEARGDLMSLLSDEAKGLVLGELLDMRAAAQKADATHTVRVLDGAIRRVARGLYRYELRREIPPAVDFDPTTGRAGL